MAHFGALRGIEPRQRLRHHGVEPLRALTAAEYQEARPRCAAGEARRRLRKIRNVGANRVADGAGPDPRRKAAGKGLEDLRGDARQPAIGHPRHGILLVNQQRDRQQPRRDAARAAHVSAGAQHHGGLDASHDPDALQDGAADPKWRHRPGCNALAADACNLHPLDRETVRRHEARLHASRHAEPHHRHLPFAQDLGDGERGKYVSARAAGHDHHGAVHRAPPGVRMTAERDVHFTS